MPHFHLEAFDSGGRIGGFEVVADTIGEALLKASKNIELVTRPHLQELRISRLADKSQACDLECGQQFFKGDLLCRHGRDPNEAIASLRLAGIRIRL